MKTTEIEYDVDYEHIEAAIANYLFSMRLIPLNSEVTGIDITLPKRKNAKVKMVVKINDE